MRVTGREIAADLRGLGIGTGDLVVVHSSLSSLGHVEGGAGTVVEAFLEVLGPTGNLVVPTFSFTFATWYPGALFEPSSTPSKVGAITEAVRTHPKSVRSLHPTHSVAAIGPLAEELTRDHLASSPIGPGSPFDRVRRRNGKILMLGCGLTSCSMFHLYEVLASLPYIDVAFRPGYSFEPANIGRSGKKIVGLELYEIPGCSAGFGKAEPILEEARILHRGRVQNASCMLFRSHDAGEVLIPRLRRNPGLLLCSEPECPICPRRRAAISNL